MGADKTFKTTRSMYKSVKKYDHNQFDEFFSRVYNSGYEKGVNEREKNVTEITGPVVGIEDVLEVVKGVKGVGPALYGRIRSAVDEFTEKMKEEQRN